MPLTLHQQLSQSAVRSSSPIGRHLLLDMHYGETSALLMVVMLLQLASYVLWGLYNLSTPANHAFVHVEVILRVMGWLSVSAVLGLIWLALCWTHRREPRWQMTLSIGAVALYVITMVYAGFISGLLAMSLGVILGCAPMLGILIFPPLVIFMAIVVAGVVLCALTWLTVNGSLPYAPLFQEALWSQYPAYARFYVLSQLYFVLPFFVMTVSMAHYLLTQWRSREATILHLSQTDALTGLYNRRTAHLHLLSLLQESQGMPISAVIVDLDHFKHINDQFGHLIGDRALRCAAQSLRSNLRNEDLIARFGGEEFLIIFKGLGCHSAGRIAERCRQQLEQLNIQDETGQRVPVTASFGVACMLSEAHADPDEVLRQADHALYEAKSGGRNRVEVHPCATAIAEQISPEARRQLIRPQG